MKINFNFIKGHIAFLCVLAVILAIGWILSPGISATHGVPIALPFFLFGVAGVGLGYLALIVMQFDYQLDHHGNSRWAVRKDLKEFLVKPNKPKAKGMYLGMFESKPMYLYDNLPIMVDGPTGAAKTSAYVIPMVLRDQHSSYIFTDPSGELFELLSGPMKKNGYKVYKLSIGTFATSQKNPFGDIDDDLRIGIQRIAKRRIKKGPQEAPIWSSGSRSIFLGLSLYIWEIHGKERLTMHELYRLGNHPHLVDFLLQEIKTKGLSESARLPLEGWINQDSELRSNQLSHFKSAMSEFANPFLDVLTRESDFSWHDLHEEKIAVFLSTPDGLMEDYSEIQTMMILDMAKSLTISVKKDRKRSINLMLEEIGDYVDVESFLKGVTKYRKYGIRTILILQGEDRIIDNFGKDSAKVIMDQMFVHIWFTPGSTETVEEVTAYLDKLTENKYSPKGFFGAEKQVVARPLMTKAEIQQLPGEDVIIRVKGKPPIWAKKGAPRYFDDSRFTDIMKMSPPVEIPALDPAVGPPVTLEFDQRLGEIEHAFDQRELEM